MTSTPVQRFTYRVRFLTPAFLGDAEQSAAWRTPPFKAMLRQWWRVVYATDMRHRVDIDTMRRAEGRLFGVAADDGGESRRSDLRLRLDSWEPGTLKTWVAADEGRVNHPEVPRPVGAHLYLGYGPLAYANQTVIKRGAALQSGASAVLRLAVPDSDADRMVRALALFHAYGAMGGRSRNGWGSVALSADAPDTPALSNPAGHVAPIEVCMSGDWPIAVGSDGRGALVWQTAAVPDWARLMRRMAEIKIGLRTSFSFKSGRDAPAPEPRHWLAYPVTNHSVKAWGQQLRLPNSLRFKVREDTDGQLRGVIFHMPCLPPPAFRPDRPVIQRVWQDVHAHLDRLERDSTTPLRRIPF